jgi:16S rRNA (guanine527-N7)-methyltransferase
MDRLAQWCEEQGSPLSAEQREAFEDFEEHLYVLNESMNMTRVPREECEERHFIDSLLISDLLPEASRVLDIGTGPGFPSWPLALMRPDLTMVAMDGTEKYFDFIATHPLDNLTLIKNRAESHVRREQFHVVTGRALAPLGIQMELSAAYARLDGAVIPFRTPAEAEEVEEFPAGQLGLELHDMVVKPLPSGAERLFPIFVKTRQTPREFPRPWARMKLKPLGKRAELREEPSSL